MTLQVAYKRPDLECTQEEDYIVTPTCDENTFPGQTQDCDQYISTRCISYELSSDPDDIVSVYENYIIKFKSKSSNNKSFSMALKKVEKFKKRGIFDKPSEEQMNLFANMSKGDFKKIKVRRKGGLRFQTRIILK